MCGGNAGARAAAQAKGPGYQNRSLDQRSSPDERSDIRGHSNTAPDFASPASRERNCARRRARIRATLVHPGYARYAPTDLAAKTDVAPWLIVGINEMTDIVVAERVFRDLNSGASVTARKIVAERNEDLSDWSCKICIEGLATPFERPIFGVDSFRPWNWQQACFARFWKATRRVLLFWTDRRGIAPCR